MSADSEKPNIIGGSWMKYCTVARSMVGVGRFERPSSSARARRLRSAASSINCGRHVLAFTMRRALRKRRVFGFVPSYLKASL